MGTLNHEQAPIAVIGFAGRTGAGPDPESLWDAMERRAVVFSEPPPGRPEFNDWPEGALRRAAFLDEIANFDATLFGISPREAEMVDPQQRLILQAAWRAAEDSGTPIESLRSRPVGVFVGALWHDYELLRLKRGIPLTQHSSVGASADILSARLSYAWGLRGPSLTVESSCSSSLVALHLACGALASGEIEEAFVAGVNLLMMPETSLGLTLFGGLSPTSRLRPFRAGADGFVRGEGAIAVHVKPLEAALRDGNPVHGVIIATGTNNDGGGDSLVTPLVESQQALLEEVYATIPDHSSRLAYIEAHGTGTSRGDPIEATAIGRAVGRSGNPVAIGSVKATIGHLEPAAGLAGLLKVLLALRHGRVPAMPADGPVSPEIDFAALGITVPVDDVPLPNDDSLLLGVNSFGWGGTNAHVVVGPPPVGVLSGTAPVDIPAGPMTLRLSAASRADLTPVARSWSECLSSADPSEWPTLLAAHERHRTALVERCAVLLDESANADIVRALPAAVTSTDDDSLSIQKGPRAGFQIIQGRRRTPGRVCFVFPGQGAQWPGMGAGLYAVAPAFRKRLDECATALMRHLPGVDIRDLVTTPDRTEWLDKVDLVQPALWAVTCALAAEWEHRGLRPDVVVGHSQGEIAAATTAGILSVDDAALVVGRRSGLLRDIAGSGRMLSVQRPVEDIEKLLGDFEGLVELAVHNGPTSAVLSGDSDAILLIQEILEAEGVWCRLVDVDYASHSASVESLLPQISAALEGIAPRAGKLAMLSTVTAAYVNGSELGPDYWTSNLRSRVRFSEALDKLQRGGVTHFIEVSPHPLLATAITDHANQFGEAATVLTTLHRHGGTLADFEAAAARAWVSGLDLRQDRALPDVVSQLPRYPFQGRPFWYDESSATPPSADSAILLPLPTGVLGRSEALIGINDGVTRWLQHHRVGGICVMPAALSIVLALTHSRVSELKEVEVPEPCVLDGSPRSVSVSIGQRSNGGDCFVRAARDDGSPSTLLRARMASGVPDAPPSTPPVDDLVSVSTDDFYDACARRGVDYGPVMRVLGSLRRGPGVAMVRLSPKDPLPPFHGMLHPILLDAILQSALAVDLDNPEVIPCAFDSITVNVHAVPKLSAATATAIRRTDGRVDIEACHEETVIVRVRGLTLAPIERAIAGTGIGWQLVETAEGTVTRSERPRKLHLVGDAVIGPDVAAELDIGFTEWTDHIPSFVDDVILLVRPGADAREALADVATQLSQRPKEVRLLVAVTGALPDNPAPDPFAAAILGMFTVLQTEHPELRPRLVDLEPGAQGLGDALRAWYLASDDVMGVRKGTLQTYARARLPLEDGPVSTISGPVPFSVIAERPGELGSVVCQARDRVQSLAEDEVLIAVEAASLNFIDVLKAAGTYPDPRDDDPGVLGLDGAGLVKAVGSGVSRFMVGDRVVFAAPGALSSHVRVRDAFVRHCPADLRAAEAGALPMVFVTAWHALVDLARVRPGHRVLVHSAAGGLGQACVQVVRHLGGEVVASAGTAAKRAFLRDQGISVVLDSRADSWPEDLLRKFPGGVDVVVNSLTGAMVDAGLRVLSPGGRFIEVGKRDIYQGQAISLEHFAKVICMVSVDIASMLRDRPDEFCDVFDRVWELVASGDLKPLPTTEFTFREAAEGFRALGSGGVIGKVVLTSPNSAEDYVRPRPWSALLGSDSVHVITGGIGAIGLEIAEDLVKRGAAQVALLGRNLPSPEAASRVAAMCRTGAHVDFYRCDVSSRKELAATLDRVRSTQGPIVSVLHLAGVLGDGTLASVDRHRLDVAWMPKAHAAGLLDELTRDDQLEAFVLFSSCAALVGTAGQAGYAAANGALDGLAASRRSLGRVGMSIQWPPVTGKGAGVRSGGTDRLASYGLSTLSIHEVGRVLDEVARSGAVCVAPMSIDLGRWGEVYPATAALTSWARLATPAQSAALGPGESAWRSLTGAERMGWLLNVVRGQASRIMRTDESNLDDETPLRSLGLDSLMTLELRLSLERQLGLRLSPTLVWKYGSPAALSRAIAELVEKEEAAEPTDAN